MPALKSIKKKEYKTKRIVVVADKGLNNGNNIALTLSVEVDTCTAKVREGQVMNLRLTSLVKKAIPGQGKIIRKNPGNPNGNKCIC
jgi:hypothetical protein